MDDQITVGHPFYFPSQVIMVDDDADFLEGVSLMLDKNLSFRLFQSATEALDYVNHSHQHVNFLQRCYSNYKTGPMDSDSLSHVDIGKLHEEIYNDDRFQTSSTVVVDYSMPEMNGLEFLMALKNPFIKKVLLTGQADTELAIKAFNKQLIDQYIDKHDPRLKKVLNNAIASFQDQYFRNSFKLITDPIIAQNYDAFLTDAGFQQFFEEMREKTGCVEYYLIEKPHAGYLMVDERGKRRCLLIHGESSLAEHAGRLQEAGAPGDLVSEVKCGETLPIFDVQEVEPGPGLFGDKNRINFYHPGLKAGSNNDYFVTIIADEDLPASYSGTILPYADFIEGNSLGREIVH